MKNKFQIEIRKSFAEKIKRKPADKVDSELVLKMCEALGTKDQWAAVRLGKLYAHNPRLHFIDTLQWLQDLKPQRRTIELVQARLKLLRISPTRPQ
jgi:hypothetical protein